jgi:hypothetical protein
VWRVEVVALIEHLEGEVGEDRARPLGHATEVAGIASTPESEVDRLLERAQAVEVDGRRVEGVEECVDAGEALGHPRRGRTGRGRRQVDAVCDLYSHKRRHPLRGWKARYAIELSPDLLFVRCQLVAAHPGGLEQGKAEQALGMLRG